ncbi:coiled-coil domain-containing protein 181-like [Rhopilema esculentum]|uniref:coiled-coil domain-containing protein 181-like n=2 Tax=Rhopilema esculentum TaxID=499914 RepID=UPI0031D6AB47
MAEELKPKLPDISVSGTSEDEGNSPRREEIGDEDKYANSDSDQDSLKETTSNGHVNSGLIDNDMPALAEKLSKVDVESEDIKFSSNDIVGDRILIERDGKFELVDASEVKAEYFQMMGIEEDLGKESSPEEKPPLESAKSMKEDSTKNNPSNRTSPRPKTSPLKAGSSKVPQKSRAKSSYARERNYDEYSHIKSRYAMTDHQLEMKRRREEAIARRKKEEDERLQEENNRKRDEAEKAFQAWLKIKNEEALEKRKYLGLKNDSKLKEDRNKAAQDAYEVWLHEKSKQKKQEKEMERRKFEEEVSTYVIRERQTCEEAFNRWLKKKRIEEKKKLAAKKPRRQRKAKKKGSTDPKPINTSAIRFTDYYGYRNTVAL